MPENIEKPVDKSPAQQKLDAVRKYVGLALDEIHHVIAFHETWRPTAYDDSLHERMGRSYATNAFRVVRSALRRETLLALLRMWDTNGSAIQLTKIANILGDQRVIDLLAAEQESAWINTPIHIVGEGIHPPDVLAEIVASARKHEEDFAKRQSSVMRQEARQVVADIKAYDIGGPKHEILRQLRNIRNARLAHRQIEVVEASAPTELDDKVEKFYQDVLSIIKKLRFVTEATDYDIESVVKHQADHAELLWKSAKGERTEGHPDYKPPRVWPTTSGNSI